MRRRKDLNQAKLLLKSAPYLHRYARQKMEVTEGRLCKENAHIPEI